jgi:hypothetical protein
MAGIGNAGAATVTSKRQLTTGGVPLSLPAVGADEVALVGTDDGTTVRAFLAEDAPKLTAGGGVEGVNRPGRRAITTWRGYEAFQMSIAMMIDGFRSGTSVEAACRNLEVLSGAMVADDPAPQKLVVIGPSVPHSFAKASQNRWVISEPPDWGDVLRNGSGDRIRQTVTVTLSLWTETDQLERVKPRKAAPKYTVTVAHQGDTYLKIAARELGTQRLGRKLAQLNDDRDPAKELPRGHKVRLPSAHTLDEWKKDL